MCGVSAHLYNLCVGCLTCGCLYVQDNAWDVCAVDVWVSGVILMYIDFDMYVCTMILICMHVQ